MPFMTMMLPRELGSRSRRTQGWKYQRNVQQAQTDHGEAHDGTGGKATRRPLFRAFEAACAVRALELVAIFMPISGGQHGPDTTGQEREGVNLDSISPLVANAIMRRTRNHQKTLATVVYRCFR